MSNKNINIDDYFKDALKDFRVEPPARKMPKVPFWRKPVFIWGSLSAVVLLGVGAWLVSHMTGGEQSHIEPTFDPMEQTTTVPAQEEKQTKDTVYVAQPGQPIENTAVQNSNTKTPDNKSTTAKPELKKGQRVITETTTTYETYEVDEDGNEVKVSSGTSQKRDTAR
ncbi:MAG: hypothetical protein ACKOXB_09200 [Flavobacteriales bacterium]